MVVGLEADQRAERREEQRQRHHQRHEPGRHAELDDHHAVERAGEQHDGHADRDLEEREAEQAGQRQVVAGGVGERQEARTQDDPGLGQLIVQLADCRLARRRLAHGLTSSIAWLV